MILGGARGKERGGEIAAVGLVYRKGGGGGELLMSPCLIMSPPMGGVENLGAGSGGPCKRL